MAEAFVGYRWSKGSLVPVTSSFTAASQLLSAARSLLTAAAAVGSAVRKNCESS